MVDSLGVATVLVEVEVVVLLGVAVGVMLTTRLAWEADARKKRTLHDESAVGNTGGINLN